MPFWGLRFVSVRHISAGRDFDAGMSSLAIARLDTPDFIEGDEVCVVAVTSENRQVIGCVDDRERSRSRSDFAFTPFIGSAGIIGRSFGSGTATRRLRKLSSSTISTGSSGSSETVGIEVSTECISNPPPSWPFTIGG